MPSEHVTLDRPLGPPLRLTAYVRELMGARDEHLQAATEIDAELKALHAILAEDIPGRGPDRVLTPPPSVVDAQPQTAGALETASAPGRRRYAHRPPEAECDALILAAVDAGTHKPRDIAKACDPLPWETIRHALYSLVDRGILSRTGQTQNTRYTRAKATGVPKTAESSPAAVSSRSSVRVPSSVAGVTLNRSGLGVEVAAAPVFPPREPEYEVAWRPHRDAPSLIGNRVTRSAQ